jgi:hypothetical protein
VPCTVLHHDEKLSSVGFDKMLPPVQWSPVEYRIARGVALRGVSRHDQVRA